MRIGRREQIGLAILLGIVALAGFYKLAVVPQHRQAAKLSTQITGERGQVLAAQQSYAQGRAARAWLVSHSKQYAAAQRAVPESSNVPSLVRLLQRSAVRAHVELVTIAFSGSGSSGSSAAASSGGATETDGTTTVPVALTFDGGYQALNRLVAVLDSFVVISHDHFDGSGPLVGISNIGIANAGQTGAGGASGLTVNLTATIYQRGSAASVLGPTEGAS